MDDCTKLPPRLQDVLYGKTTERTAILDFLARFSREYEAKLAEDPAYVEACGGERFASNALVDRVADLIRGAAHVRDEGRVEVPWLGGAPLVVGASAKEREHFARPFRAKPEAAASGGDGASGDVGSALGTSPSP